MQHTETVEFCPGNCGNEERIEFIRQQFPKLKLDNLTTMMKKIAELKQIIGMENNDR